ncbi:uncharacterized protein K460DRAFT_361038 [Cucurbitaria berberidis CBS 394.84]|uniref:Uncharacterized protein n=1 Tax=Cucurbitaria berberidis CBS 394.84 TaxID=1168544 RepID=A0A9P4GRW8_9PLEO|nr:uncharacterized protein K460DRAFT_361038 [Cucurbitaria berberidis CBS 394.84]KAF1850212.1 hypothetical protein K460DRAFT_361038 [Cucurbitaria berberidis CBS 394.84]
MRYLVLSCREYVLDGWQSSAQNHYLSIAVNTTEGNFKLTPSYRYDSDAIESSKQPSKLKLLTCDSRCGVELCTCLIRRIGPLVLRHYSPASPVQGVAGPLSDGRNSHDASVPEDHPCCLSRQRRRVSFSGLGRHSTRVLQCVTRDTARGPGIPALARLAALLNVDQ